MPSPNIAVCFSLLVVVNWIDEFHSVSLKHTIPGTITYVDHSPEYIFTCGGQSLRVFSRLTGQCVYEISSTFGNYAFLRWKIGGQKNKTSRFLKCTSGYVDGDPLIAWDDAGSALYQHILVKDEVRPNPLEDRIIASTSIIYPIPGQQR